MIAALLAATPLPPATDDVDALLAAAGQMLAARAAVLARFSDPARGPKSEVELVGIVELSARDAAWRDAIAAATRLVGGRRIAAAAARRYRQACRQPAP